MCLCRPMERLLLLHNAPADRDRDQLGKRSPCADERARCGGERTLVGSKSFRARMPESYGLDADTKGFGCSARDMQALLRQAVIPRTSLHSGLAPHPQNLTKTPSHLTQPDKTMRSCRARGQPRSNGDLLRQPKTASKQAPQPAQRGSVAGMFSGCGTVKSNTAARCVFWPFAKKRHSEGPRAEHLAGTVASILDAPDAWRLHIASRTPAAVSFRGTPTRPASQRPGQIAEAVREEGWEGRGKDTVGGESCESVG